MTIHQTLLDLWSSGSYRTRWHFVRRVRVVYRHLALLKTPGHQWAFRFQSCASKCANAVKIVIIMDLSRRRQSKSRDLMLRKHCDSREGPLTPSDRLTDRSLSHLWQACPTRTDWCCSGFLNCRAASRDFLAETSCLGPERLIWMKEHMDVNQNVSWTCVI